MLPSVKESLHGELLLWKMSFSGERLEVEEISNVQLCNADRL